MDSSLLICCVILLCPVATLAIRCYVCDHCKRVENADIVGGCTSCKTSMTVLDGHVHTPHRTCSVEECSMNAKIHGDEHFLYECCTTDLCNNLVAERTPDVTN
ncbi:hypothetical protein CRM22_001134 [Opisthorchis felineus]|uniref:UPAR/Ly6 domain-containing protein n=1 Tax=Opisthorchis felineus TaxID=147828 RepID=A0A4S2MG75_OPIFE|nr:hypothetical protein CRM22_001134 [Opisthorchis felineus]